MGLISQVCPSGWADIGVACQRPTYTRAPTPGIAFRIRDRKANQQDQTPKTCTELNIKDPDTLAYCNSLLCLADEDIATGSNGQDFCVSRCRDSYLPAPNGMCVRQAGGIDSLTGNPFTADQYQRRNPFLITWEVGNTPPSKAESDWTTFTAADATDVAAQDFRNLLGTGPNLIINSATGFGVTDYTGNQDIQGGDISGNLYIQAQGTLLNGDNVLLAQDGANVLVYDESTNETRTFAGDLGTFDPGSWAKYAVSTLGFTLGSKPVLFVVGTTVALRNSATGNFLTADTSGINTDQQSSDSLISQWLVVDAGGGLIALQNASSGTYLSQTSSNADVHDTSITTDSSWSPISASSTDTSLVGLSNGTTKTLLNASASGSVDLSATSITYGSTWRVQRP